MPSKRNRVGLWMIGAHGSVGSSVALGLAALRKGLIPPTGLVTALPPFQGAGLVAPEHLVLGGHEIRKGKWIDEIRELHEQAGLFDHDLIRRCKPFLRSTDLNIRPGTLQGSSPTVRSLSDGFAIHDRTGASAVRRLANDILKFREKHRLREVVVVHIASSEPPARKALAFGSFDVLMKSLRQRGAGVIPASALYAMAAVEAKCAFVNFTPSVGIGIPAIQNRARELGVPYMGSDGKTGESLVKSALAPMFATRHLSILSWVGHNLLGNRDGAVLRDPKTRNSKLKSKDRIVTQIAGTELDSHVSIDYVRSLHDWKVAWDHIHFEGFLKTKMTMQFTWQGCDSILAAPLIIDLARLAAKESQARRGGPMKHLAFFFKDPIGVDIHDLAGQWRMLIDHFVEPASPKERRTHEAGL